MSYLINLLLTLYKVRLFYIRKINHNKATLNLSLGLFKLVPLLREIFKEKIKVFLYGIFF